MSETRTAQFSLALAPAVFFAPRKVFSAISESRPSPARVFFGYALWVGLVPPICAGFGSMLFGWRLGAEEPVILSPNMIAAVCAAYYLALLAGFVLAARIVLWMRPTYAGESTPGECFALIAAVGTPMMLCGALHLYPSFVLNVAFFTPAFLWSVYLLYTGLPLVLKNGAERGMLMATSTVGFFLVALAGFLALVVILWTRGFGPPLGV